MIKVDMKPKLGNLLHVASNIADEAEKLILELRINRSDIQQVLAASLLIRAESNYRAVLLVGEWGFASEAKIVARSLMEAVFTLVAIAGSRAAAERFIFDDDMSRLDLMKKFRQLHKSNWPEGFGEEDLSQLEARIKADVERRETKKTTTADWAKMANLYDFYLTAYAVFSLSTHAKARDLDGYLERDETGDMKGFNLDPDADDITRTLCSCGEIMLNAIRAVAKLFDANKEPFIAEAHDRLKNLVAGID